MKRHLALVLAGVLLVCAVVALIFEGFTLKPDEFSALAAGIQTVFVVVSLIIAVSTFLRDSNDKRIDRVHDLHRELTSGELGAARSRLGSYLRSTDPVRICSLAELGHTRYPKRIRKKAGLAVTPRGDATLLLRFFERAWIAHEGHAVTESAFVALIGRHAVWWDCALATTDSVIRSPLNRLAEWSNTYAKKHPREPGLEEWGVTRSRDFPSLYK